jgi:hypothetical protein
MHYRMELGAAVCLHLRVVEVDAGDGDALLGDVASQKNYWVHNTDSVRK